MWNRNRPCPALQNSIDYSGNQMRHLVCSRDLYMVKSLNKQSYFYVSIILIQLYVILADKMMFIECYYGYVSAKKETIGGFRHPVEGLEIYTLLESDSSN